MKEETEKIYCCRELEEAYKLKMIYPVAGTSLGGYMRANPPIVEKGPCSLCDEEATIEDVLSINYCPFCGHVCEHELMEI